MGIEWEYNDTIHFIEMHKEKQNLIDDTDRNCGILTV